MKTYKVIADSENVYLPNTLITSDTLINDYLVCCNQKEDADLIGWLQTLIKNDRQDKIIKYKK